MAACTPGALFSLTPLVPTRALSERSGSTDGVEVRVGQNLRYSLKTGSAGLVMSWRWPAVRIVTCGITDCYNAGTSDANRALVLVVISRDPVLLEVELVADNTAVSQPVTGDTADTRYCMLTVP